MGERLPSEDDTKRVIQRIDELLGEGRRGLAVSRPSTSLQPRRDEAPTMGYVLDRRCGPGCWLLRLGSTYCAARLIALSAPFDDVEHAAVSRAELKLRQCLGLDASAAAHHAYRCLHFD